MAGVCDFTFCKVLSYSSLFSRRDPGKIVRKPSPSRKRRHQNAQDRQRDGYALHYGRHAVIPPISVPRDENHFGVWIQF